MKKRCGEQGVKETSRKVATVVGRLQHLRHESSVPYTLVLWSADSRAPVIPKRVTVIVISGFYSHPAPGLHFYSRLEPHLGITAWGEAGWAQRQRPRVSGP